MPDLLSRDVVVQATLVRRHLLRFGRMLSHSVPAFLHSMSRKSLRIYAQNNTRRNRCIRIVGTIGLSSGLYICNPGLCPAYLAGVRDRLAASCATQDYFGGTGSQLLSVFETLSSVSPVHLCEAGGDFPLCSTAKF